jgi:hypothetical protein
MSEAITQKWFEAIWTQRDEVLYQQFFGAAGPQGGAIYTLNDAAFRSVGAECPDPRFLTHGVFEFAPTETRTDWLYVSAGMSNPWGQTPETANPAEYSGLGYEFVLHAPERGRWPIQLLHWLMAVQLLVAIGQFQGELLQHHDRIPLGGALAKKDGMLTHVLVASPDEAGLAGAPADDLPHYPPQFHLPSGIVDLMILVGITEREADFARTQGVEGLITLLRHRHFFPRTDPARITVV